MRVASLERHLRSRARWSLLTLWVFPGVAAVIANGGFGTIESRAPMIWFAGGCALVSGFHYLIAINDRFLRWALKPDADVEGIEGTLLWTVFGYGALAIIGALGAVFWNGP